MDESTSQDAIGGCIYSNRKQHTGEYGAYYVVAAVIE